MTAPASEQFTLSLEEKDAVPSTAAMMAELSNSASTPNRSGVQRRNTNPEMDPYVASQQHLLQATENNPLPTAVPPPIAANAGTLGVRHVLCIIGLPERGKPYIARRLQAYLSFFHGAEVQVYDLTQYQQSEPGSDANADALLKDLKQFMIKENFAAGSNMDVASSKCEDSLLVDEKDRRRKNVDSGKVAIIMATDSHACFKEKWSGTSKERRQWAAQQLANDKQMNAKLIYIEVIVNKPALVEANIRAKRRGMGAGDTSALILREHNVKVKQYSRMYVTLQVCMQHSSSTAHCIPSLSLTAFLASSFSLLCRQDDGSEDDLSYIKLYNYGGKVVTNRMHGYLRMRIAQFLTTTHTTPHVIFLSRHGQSEYNVLGKIGGNPPLSEAGKRYAERLGEWVPQNICHTKSGLPIKARLWTSSLQRTILTAEHIPHPIIPITQLLSAMQGAEAFLPETDIADPGANDEYAAQIRAAAAQMSIASGASPPPELQDADTDGMWEQMSPRVYRNLDEIFAGEYEGMRYEDIKRLRPDEASLRAMDKIGYRYPRGESYFDILSRLDPLVHEMESYHEPLLIVSHQAVLRVLYAYLMGKPRSSA